MRAGIFVCFFPAVPQYLEQSVGLSQHSVDVWFATGVHAGLQPTGPQSERRASDRHPPLLLPFSSPFPPFTDIKFFCSLVQNEVLVMSEITGSKNKPNKSQTYN